eukprot:1027455-Rhodomonas_salina.3
MARQVDRCATLSGIDPRQWKASSNAHLGQNKRKRRARASAYKEAHVELFGEERERQFAVAIPHPLIRHPAHPTPPSSV